MKKKKINDEENNKSNDNSITKNKTKNKNERVLVFVRIRPFIENELEYDNTSSIISIDTENNSMTCKNISKIY